MTTLPEAGRSGSATDRRRRQHGTLIDIQWQVYVANKKACWYQFETTHGEHGYRAGPSAPQCRVTDDREPADHRSRPAHRERTRPSAAPRSTAAARAIRDDVSAAADPFDRHARRDDDRRCRPPASCSAARTIGQREVRPGRAAYRDYANNDGWYDDTSDGPVMARL
jgi:hypothetical protein